MLKTNINHGGKYFSATIIDGRTVVFDRPAHTAGAPGTVPAATAAKWTEQDWTRLARERRRALRQRQHASNLIGCQPPCREYAGQERRQRDRRPRWTTKSGPASVDVHYGGTLVETWRREDVPGMGRVWACYPAGHAFPVGYSDKPPDRDGRVA